MVRILEVRPEVTAAFAMSDVQAIGAWKAARDAGKRVPNDIAIVGYDDIKTSYYIGLSSVDQRMHWVGEEATELLLQHMQGEHDELRVERRIVPQLVGRDSSVPF